MKDKKIKWGLILGFFILGIGSCSYAGAQKGWDGLIPALLGLASMAISFLSFFVTSTVEYVAKRKRRESSDADSIADVTSQNESQNHTAQLLSHHNLKACLIFFGIADLLFMYGIPYGYPILIWIFRIMVASLLLMFYSQGQKWILYIMILILIICMLKSMVALFMNSDGLLSGIFLFMAPFFYYYVIYILTNHKTEGLFFKDKA